MSYILSRHEGPFEIKGQRMNNFNTCFDYRECRICGRREVKASNNTPMRQCPCYIGRATVTEWDGTENYIAWKPNEDLTEVKMLYSDGTQHTVSASYFWFLVRSWSRG